MAKRSSAPRIPGPREKNVELSCMWGLFSILQSCQGLTSPKFISNGRSISRHAFVDPQRKLQQPTSHDGECRKIRDEVEAFNVSERGAQDFIQGDLSIGKNKIKEIVGKGQQHAKMDSVRVHDLAKARNRARRNSEQVYQLSSFSGLDDAASLTDPPSASADVSLNELAVVALLEAVSAPDLLEEGSLYECFQRSVHHGKHDRVSMQQVQTNAKALVDQMFIDRELAKKQHGLKYESKSFSNSLEVLNLNKGRLIDLLPEPDSLLLRRFKNARPSGTEKESIKLLLDAKLSKYTSKEASTSQKRGSTSAVRKGKMNKHSWQKIDYQCSCSRKTSSVSQPRDKIVVLKPALQSAKNFEYVTCDPSYFTFRETKKKLNRAFGSSRKEPIQRSMNGPSDALAPSKAAPKVGNDSFSPGIDTKRFSNPSTSVNMNGKVGEKQELKSNRGSGVGCVTDTVGKKQACSGVSLSEKQEFDVALEAKRHLSERLRSRKDVVDVRNEQPLTTVRRILASPEHDFCLLSPRRNSQYFSSSSRMCSSDDTHPAINERENTCPISSLMFSSENSSKIPTARENTCPSSLRLSTKLMSCADYGKDDGVKKSSLMATTGEEAHEMDTSTVNIKKSNGQLEIIDLDDMLGSELHGSEASSGINITQVTRNELHKNDDSVNRSMLDSLSENDAFTSPADDFQYTPSSVYQSDVADSIKYQEEHQSPVSVLEPFFIEYADSPQNTTLQTARQPLQPLRLDFEEHAIEPLPSDPPTSASSCTTEQDPLFEYVHLIMQASHLDWDQLLKTRSLPEELLPASLFDEVEFLPTDCYFDPRLLFDHINEVLIQIHRSHFCSLSPLSPIKPKSMSASLAELVLNQITTQADFYLLPQTERRTLDQLVSGNTECCRSWLNLQPDNELIIADIAEVFLEECILDVLLESLT